MSSSLRCPCCPQVTLFKGITHYERERIPFWGCVECGGAWHRLKVKGEFVLGTAFDTFTNGALDWDAALKTFLATKGA